jgi:hypothetical protein
VVNFLLNFQWSVVAELFLSMDERTQPQNSAESGVIGAAPAHRPKTAGAGTSSQSYGACQTCSPSIGHRGVRGMAADFGGLNVIEIGRSWDRNSSAENSFAVARG